MNPGAGYAGVITWSLDESRERLVLHPSIHERVFLLTLLQNIFHHIHKRFRLPGSSFYSQMLFSIHQQ
jgi:hypothetical protein